MKRVKKETQSVTLRMEKELCDRLNDYCARSGQSKTVAIERAVDAYIKNYDEERKVIENTISPAT